MRTTKKLDSAGEYLNIPIDDNDQTVGLTIVGPTFSGMLQLVGLVSSGGREIEITAYNPDGTVGDINADYPVDVFLDVAGFLYIRLIVLSVTSGFVLATALTTSAGRVKLNDNGGIGNGQEVIVTNFPAVYNVVGPLTNTQLRAQPVPVVMTDGIDSAGNPLPLNFKSYPAVLTYDNNLLQSISRTVGTDVYTKTYTYDGSGNITVIPPWVKS